MNLEDLANEIRKTENIIQFNTRLLKEKEYNKVR